MSVLFRNVSSDTRSVGFGVLIPQAVAPDGVVAVDDAAAGAYDCQPSIWQPVDPAAADTRAPAAPAAEPEDQPNVARLRARAKAELSAASGSASA